MPAKKGILLFAHGASDPEWAEPFERLRNRLIDTDPASPVALGYLEKTSPSLIQAAELLVSSGCKEIHIFPLFLARGGHLKHDLPLLCEALKRQRPEIAIVVHASLGESETFLAYVAKWVVAELRPRGASS